MRCLEREAILFLRCRQAAHGSKVLRAAGANVVVYSEHRPKHLTPSLCTMLLPGPRSSYSPGAGPGLSEKTVLSYCRIWQAENGDDAARAKEFIQSRGRARARQASMVLMVEQGNQDELELIHHCRRCAAGTGLSQPPACCRCAALKVSRLGLRNMCHVYSQPDCMVWHNATCRKQRHLVHHISVAVTCSKSHCCPPQQLPVQPETAAT